MGSELKIIFLISPVSYFRQKKLFKISPEQLVSCNVTKSEMSLAKGFTFDAKLSINIGN